MCNPVAATMVVGALLQGHQQAKIAKRQEKAAVKSAQVKQDEMDMQAQQQVSERVAQARRERGRMLVAQGESGLSMGSTSFEESIIDTQSKAAKDVAVIQSNARSAGRANKAALSDTLAGIPTGTDILMSTAAKAAQAGAQHYDR